MLCIKIFFYIIKHFICRMLIIISTLVEYIRKKSCMLQEKTKLRSFDNSGARWVKCIRVIGKKKKFGFIGDLLAVIVQSFKFKKKLIKKKIYYGLIVSMKSRLFRKNGLIIKSDSNRIVLLAKENLQFLGTRIYGPIYKEIVMITDKKKRRTQCYAKVIAYARGLI